MGFLQELRSGQYTIYAQWSALLAVPVLIILGIFELTTIPVFAILAFVFAFIITFSEIPLCLKCCPTSPRFDAFMKRFESNYFRAGMYGLFGLVEWISLAQHITVMILGALLLTVAAVCYAFAGAKHQDRKTSQLTGGTGVQATAATSAFAMA